jgi:replicative DNA helicase
VVAAKAVLGAMLIDARCVPSVMDVLRAEDFDDSLDRRIFETFRELYLDRKPIDPVLVEAALGGEVYHNSLAQLMLDTPTAANVLEYARILKDQNKLRQIQAACLEIASSSVTLEQAKALLSEAAALLVDHQADRDLSYGELLQDLLDRQSDKTPPDWLDWGIPALNERLMIGPGRFVVIGADSSVGKTALALQFALSMAKAGKRVGFFSYETSLPDATDRLAANDADVSLRQLKQKRLSRQDLARIVDAGGRGEKLPLRILETARYTTEHIRAKTLSRGFDVIFVDYVQLIPSRARDRYEAVTQISMALHRLAQDLKITVIGLSQVTVPELDKKGNRRYISMDDLRDSRQLKQDADAVLLLDLSNVKDRSSNRVLIIAKNKDDAIGRIVLSFDPHHMRFAYVPPVEGTEEKASRERVEAMDRNREKRLRKEAEKNRTALDGQGVFHEMSDEEDDESLPF